jgi:hypothetical protein
LPIAAWILHVLEEHGAAGRRGAEAGVYIGDPRRPRGQRDGQDRLERAVRDDLAQR